MTTLKELDSHEFLFQPYEVNNEKPEENGTVDQNRISEKNEEVELKGTTKQDGELAETFEKEADDDSVGPSEANDNTTEEYTLDIWALPDFKPDFTPWSGNSILSNPSVMHCISFYSSPLRPSQLFVQSHRLLFSHALTEVRGENTPERKFASIGYRTHNRQVMSPTRSPLSHPGWSEAEGRVNDGVGQGSIDTACVTENYNYTI